MNANAFISVAVLIAVFIFVLFLSDDDRQPLVAERPVSAAT